MSARPCRRAGRTGSSALSSPSRTVSSAKSGSCRALPSLIANPPRFVCREKPTRSQGPSLPRRYPASTMSGRRRRASLPSRSPPSAAQTGRAVFPHPAFMNGLSQSEETVSMRRGRPACARRPCPPVSGPSASNLRGEDDLTVSWARVVRVFHIGNFPSARSFLICLDRSCPEPSTNVLPRITHDPPSPVTRVVRLALQVLLRSPTSA